MTDLNVDDKGNAQILQKGIEKILKEPSLMTIHNGMAGRSLFFTRTNDNKLVPKEMSVLYT